MMNLSSPAGIFCFFWSFFSALTMSAIEFAGPAGGESNSPGVETMQRVDEVAVPVNKPGQHCLAAQVDDFGTHRPCS